MKKILFLAIATSLIGQSFIFANEASKDFLKAWQEKVSKLRLLFKPESGINDNSLISDFLLLETGINFNKSDPSKLPDIEDIISLKHINSFISSVIQPNLDKSRIEKLNPYITDLGLLALQTSISSKKYIDTLTLAPYEQYIQLIHNDDFLKQESILQSYFSGHLFMVEDAVNDMGTNTLTIEKKLAARYCLHKAIRTFQENSYMSSLEYLVQMRHFEENDKQIDEFFWYMVQKNFTKLYRQQLSKEDFLELRDIVIWFRAEFNRSDELSFIFQELSLNYLVYKVDEANKNYDFKLALDHLKEAYKEFKDNRFVYMKLEKQYLKVVNTYVVQLKIMDILTIYKEIITDYPEEEISLIMKGFMEMNVLFLIIYNPNLNTKIRALQVSLDLFPSKESEINSLLKYYYYESVKRFTSEADCKLAVAKAIEASNLFPEDEIFVELQSQCVKSIR